MGETDDEGRSIFDPQTLRQLFRQLEATDVDELEVVVGSSRLFLRREPGSRLPLTQAEGAGNEDEPRGLPIVAPLTGVYYARPAPEQPPFVSPGDQIMPGLVVALIETMKLFNEVIAEVEGTVLSIGPRDGDLVEAGQPLMHIQPGEGER